MIGIFMLEGVSRIVACQMGRRLQSCDFFDRHFGLRGSLKRDDNFKMTTFFDRHSRLRGNDGLMAGMTVLRLRVKSIQPAAGEVI